MMSALTLPSESWPRGSVGVLQAEDGLNVAEREAEALQLFGIDFDAHGGRAPPPTQTWPTP